MKGNDLIIECKNCKYLSSTEGSSFDVTVPIIDENNGIAGNARLHCKLSAKNHSIELAEWKPTDANSEQSSGSFMNRLSTELDILADKRLCGNRHICPSEVIRISEENTHLI